MNSSKLVFGLGVYTRGSHTSRDISGNRTKVYSLWASMLSRCQPDGAVQKRTNVYTGCEVHPEFIRFQDFAEWCHNQNGFHFDGWELDKDILIPGNRIYGPDTCCFVPKHLNQLFTHKQANQGMYPTGVSYDKSRALFQAKIKIDGVTKSLGRFETPERAESAYKTAKYSEIHRLANVWRQDLDPRIYTAILNYRI